RAINALGKFGPAAAVLLSDIVRDPEVPAAKKISAVWAASRNEAGRFVRLFATRDSDETVRQAGYHAASAWLDAPGSITRSNVRNLPRAPASNALAALELASRDELSVPGLNDIQLGANTADDPLLDHAAIYALIQQEPARNSPLV